MNMNVRNKSRTQILVFNSLPELNIHLKEATPPHSTHSLVILYKMVYIVLIYSCFSLKMGNRCGITFIERVKKYIFFFASGHFNSY